MAELTEMTGWEGQKVLYFGDHPYADLADLSLNFGWRTGALIQERDHLTITSHNQSYHKMITSSNLSS